MVDDDVVLRPSCLEHLFSGMSNSGLPWAVPYCFLVPAGLELDGYTDKPIDRNSPAVLAWTEKYPWFIPYFQYTKHIAEQIPTAGTQAILLLKNEFLDSCRDLIGYGKLPREDTYMTIQMGDGLFISQAECLHYEHPSQLTRGEWGSSMFYRLHEVIMKDPGGFMSLFGGKK